MLIGLGEPFMDRKIFDRIEYCERHSISTLLSTNGTFLDEKTCRAAARYPARAHHAELRRRHQREPSSITARARSSKRFATTSSASRA